jgi:hypothetical protein
VPPPRSELAPSVPRPLTLSERGRSDGGDLVVVLRFLSFLAALVSLRRMNVEATGTSDTGAQLLSDGLELGVGKLLLLRLEEDDVAAVDCRRR